MFIPLVAIILHIAILYAASDDDKKLLTILLISSIYYSFLGPIYWAYERDYTFVGVNWQLNYWRGPILLALSTTVISAVVVFSGKIFDRRVHDLNKIEYTLIFNETYVLLLIFGLIGGSYLITAGIKVEGETVNLSAFALIAYQFADILIPVIIFYVCRCGLTWGTILAIAGFIAFSSIIGYRYKLVLLVLPVLLMLWQGRSLKTKVTLATLMTVLGFILSLLTVARKKFEGVEIDALLDLTVDDFLYGFFAESNLMFGFQALLSKTIDTSTYAGFSPIYDAFADFIPRFLFQDKKVGLYVEQFVAEGLITEEGFKSGTAYPFIGEYIMMGGVWGLFIGCACFAWAYVTLRNIMVRHIRVGYQRNLLLWYLAVFFGYYCYSRGFLPQVSKTFIFVVAPIFLLLGASTVKTNKI